MAEVVADLLEAVTRLHEVAGTRVSQAMGPAPFFRQSVLREAALDDAIQSTCR